MTLLLGTVACGGDDAAPSSASSVATTASSAIASATVGASATPAPTPPATPTNAEAALAGVTDVIQRANAARCPPPTPVIGGCDLLSLDTANSSTDFDHGLGTFKVNNPQEGETTIVVGRTTDGQWFQYVWGDPVKPLYNPIQLPATVTICGFGGTAKVYSSSSPSSSQAGTLADGASVSAEQFVLTLPGSVANAGVKIQGYGLYRVAQPAGWVSSKYVAAGPGCALHDQLEQP